MTAQSTRRYWRLCRIYFRRFRITVLFTALVLVCALIYLDTVGLPDPVKRQLLEGLRKRGVDLEFSRLRLRWHDGIVADNVRFRRTNEDVGPQLIAKKVSIRFNLFRFQVDALDLHGGRLVWPTNETDVSLQALNIENIETEVRLGPGDKWALEDFRAHFVGADFVVSAAITNASAIPRWEFLRTRHAGDTNLWPERLRRLANLIENISFSSPPELRLVIYGDARDPGGLHARLSLTARDANTPWAKASNVVLNVRTFADVDDQPALGDESQGWWTNTLPWNLDWNCELANLHSEKINANDIVCAGTWRAPELAVTNFHAAVGGGTMDATARLNMMSRKAEFGLVSDVDPHSIELLLTQKIRRWLSKFAWLSSPHLSGNGSVTLPAWTNRHPDWRGEVQPTLRLAGAFAVSNGAYLGLQAHWARSHFTYTNMVWNLADLEVRRAEGTLRLAYQEDDRTKDYHWQVQGPINPRSIRPILTTNQLQGFDLFAFTAPIVVGGDVCGRLYEYERIGFQLRVAATNFSIRGQSVGTFESDVAYTNRFLQLIEPNLTRGAQVMNASGVGVDFTAKRIFFTNGFSMAEPQVVANAIGPKTGHTFEPYRFTQPPVVHVEGYAPLQGSTDADLRFVVDGGPFEWLKFRVPRIEGNVYWFGKTLLLTNVQMDFYDGAGAGFALFNFKPEKGNDFKFTLGVTNADLHSLMADIGARSSRMEGRLSGLLVVTNANSADRQSWDGFGRVRLRDGFIWDIPIFGFLSPILDNIVPGLGSSRATEGAAKYIITNSVIFSDSLYVRSPLMRLQYDGTVDFDSRVDARVEAEFMRDTLLIGRIVSVVLKPLTKLLEYKVTGTLSQPKPEPVYFIPRLLLIPLHPFRSLGGFFPGESSNTNAPPAVKP